MRYIAFTAASAVLLLLSFYLGSQSFKPKEFISISEVAHQELALMIKANMQSIASINSETSLIRRQINQKANGLKLEVSNDKGVQHEDFLGRLEKVEVAIERLSLIEATTKKNGRLIEEKLSARMRRSAESSSYNQSPSTSAQSDFESDSGVPLGGYVDSIEETLHSTEGLDIKGMECRNSICKVAYSVTESMETEEQSYSEFELVDRLAQSAEGREVKVIYDKDTFGNDVMYILLR